KAVSEVRLPRNRNRENAYAAAAPITTAPSAEAPPINRVFHTHTQNMVSPSASKLVRLTRANREDEPARKPLLSSAADSAETIGNAAESTISTATGYFHPTSAHQRRRRPGRY